MEIEQAEEERAELEETSGTANLNQPGRAVDGNRNYWSLPVIKDFKEMKKFEVFND